MVKCKDTFKKNYPRLFYRSNNLFSVVDSNRCNDTEKILNSFGIALRDTNREWRNTEEVIDEVAKKWSTFTDVEQSAIAVAISGTRQRNFFVAAMENYDDVLKYTTASLNAAGTSEQKYGAYMDSMQAKLNELTVAWETFVNNLNQSDNFKTVMDAVIKLVDILDKLINKTNALNTVIIPILSGIAVSTGIKKTIEILPILSDGIKSVGVQVKTLIGLFKGTTSVANMSLSAISGWIGVAVSLIGMVVAKVNEYNQEIRESIMLAADVSDKYNANNQSVRDLTNKYTELNEELKENQGNTEEVKRIKSELYTLQEDLNSKYDEEHEKILLVNGDYEKQIELIKELNRQEAVDYLSENQGEYQSAKNRYEKEQNKLKTESTFTVFSTPEFDTEEMEKSAKIHIENLTNKVREEFGDKLTEIDGTLSLTLTAEEQPEAFDKMYSLLRDFEAESGATIDKQISRVLDFKNTANSDIDFELMESSKKIIDTYETALIQADSVAGDLYDKLQDAIKNYNSALLEGNKESIEESKEEINSIMEDVNKQITLHPDFSAGFKLLYDSIDTAMEKYREFENSLMSKDEDYLSGLKEQLDGLSFDELRAGGIEAFDELVRAAENFGLKTEDVIAILNANGIISEETKNNTTQYWNEMLNQINSAIEKMNELNSIPFEGFNTEMDVVLDNFTTSLANVETGYQSLMSAMEEFQTQGYLSAQTFKSLSDNNLLQYLSSTTNGLNVNTDSLFNNAEMARENAIQQVKLSAAKQIVEIITRGVTDAQKEEAEQSELTAIALDALNGYLANTASSSMSTAAAFQIFTKSLANTEGGADLTPFKNQIQDVLNSTKIYLGYIDNLGGNLTKVTRNYNSAAGAAGSMTDAIKEQTEALKEQKEELENGRDAIEDFMDMAMEMLKQEYKDRESAIEDEIDAENDRYDAWKDNLDRQKDLAERYYDDRLQELEDLKDATGEVYDEQIDQIEKEMDAYEKKIELQKKLLEAKKEEEDYQKELAEKVKDVAEIESELAKLQFDDSIEAQKKKIELLEQLEEKRGEVDDFQSDHAYDKQQDALDEELDRYQEMMEQKKQEVEDLKDAELNAIDEEIEAFKRSYELWKRHIEDIEYAQEQVHNKAIAEKEAEIEKLKEHYEVDGNLFNEASQRMEEQGYKNSQFYQDLIEWNRKYGTGVNESLHPLYSNV